MALHFSFGWLRFRVSCLSSSFRPKGAVLRTTRTDPTFVTNSGATNKRRKICTGTPCTCRTTLKWLLLWGVSWYWRVQCCTSSKVRRRQQLAMVALSHEWRVLADRQMNNMTIFPQDYDDSPVTICVIVSDQTHKSMKIRTANSINHRTS